jgi:hypothetical protein
LSTALRSAAPGGRGDRPGFQGLVEPGKLEIEVLLARDQEVRGRLKRRTISSSVVSWTTISLPSSHA